MFVKLSLQGLDELCECFLVGASSSPLSGVLPIQIQTVESVLLDEGHGVVGEYLTLGCGSESLELKTVLLCSHVVSARFPNGMS